MFKKIIAGVFILALVSAVPATAELSEQEFIDTFGSIKETVNPRDIDKQAAKLAKEYEENTKYLAPLTRGADGSVQYVFSTTRPRILCRPLRVTDVALEAGEKITSAPFVGDSVNWTILPSVSGSGEQTQYHIIIKPSMPDIATNLIVHTDRRTYHLDLISSKDMYTPYVSFIYPRETRPEWDDFLNRQARVSKVKELPVIPSREELSSANGRIDSNYKITPKNKDIGWVPVSVYNDGKKTYIEFPDMLDALEAPVFFATIAGNKELVNYRKYENVYIIDRIVESGVLIAGTGRTAKQVTIRKSKTPIPNNTPAILSGQPNENKTAWDILRMDMEASASVDTRNKTIDDLLDELFN